MQVGLGFRIRTAINAAVAYGADIPHMGDGRHFFLLYHLKGVCNTHCGGHHLHRPLSQSDCRTLGEFRDRYCVTSEDPPVQGVGTGGQSQASTLSARTGRHHGYRGGRITGGGGVT